MTTSPDLQASVVFATHNRAERLRDMLAGLRAQTLPRAAFEVVVVDDASSDDTSAVLAEAIERGDLHIRAIRHDHNRGPAAARNAGWRAARASFVAFSDDDCVPAAGWLDALLRAHRERPEAIVQGRTEPRPDEIGALGPFSRTLRVRSLGPFFQTCNVAYPRVLLERLAGFDEQTFTVPCGEDADLAWRGIETGSATVFAPDALVHHAVNQLGPVGKLRVAWRWSETMRIYARHAELRRTNLTHGIFWKRTHYLLLRALLAFLLPRRAWPLALWLARPYVSHVVFHRGRIEGGGMLLAPYYALHDLVEVGAAVRGAIRYRVFVL